MQTLVKLIIIIEERKLHEKGFQHRLWWFQIYVGFQKQMCIDISDIWELAQNFKNQLGVKCWYEYNCYLNGIVFVQVKQVEIEEMLSIMDKNGDGEVSYREFRVMIGALPLVQRK